jgi:nitrite reductase/ring-hydroxylating ferredoxin subunit
MSDMPTARRSFLQRCLLIGGLTISWGGLAAILLDIWLAAGRFSSAQWRSVAALDELTSDGTFPFPEQNIALLVRNQSVAAVSLECTHLGCLLNVVDDGFFCPCHGSEFGPLGEVYSGPATRSLPWHSLKINNGKVWVQSVAMQVEPAWEPLVKSNGAKA